MMTRRYIYNICLAVAVMFAASGCSVHEFPHDTAAPRHPLLLHLDVTTNLNMDLYQTIDYKTRAEGADDSKATPVTLDEFDIRYIVKVYRGDDVTRQFTRNADTTIVLTKTPQSPTDLDEDVSLMLEDGEYKFIAWADYVPRGTAADYFYKTSDFAEIILADRTNHRANTDFRDAFRGEQDARVDCTGKPSGYSQRATMVMQRPMAKFQFVSNDLDDFITRIVQLKLQQMGLSGSDVRNEQDVRANIDLNDYKIVFRYTGFMPCSINMYTNKPADAWTGVWFDSKMAKLSETEAELGFDYVFVNGSESKVSVEVEVRDTGDNVLARINPIDVPVVRNKLTIVRGAFLTATATGGAVINPDFDGEYNIIIK